MIAVNLMDRKKVKQKVSLILWATLAFLVKMELTYAMEDQELQEIKKKMDNLSNIQEKEIINAINSLETYKESIKVEAVQFQAFAVKSFLEAFNEASFEKVADLLVRLSNVKIDAELFKTSKKNKQEGAAHYLEELIQKVSDIKKEDEFNKVKAGALGDLANWYELLLKSELKLMSEISKAPKLALNLFRAEGFETCLEYIQISKEWLAAGNPKIQAMKIKVFMQEITTSEAVQTSTYAKPINAAIDALKQALPALGAGNKDVKRGVVKLLAAMETLVTTYRDSKDADLQSKVVEDVNTLLGGLKNLVQIAKSTPPVDKKDSSGGSYSGGGSTPKDSSGSTPTTKLGSKGKAGTRR